MPSCYAYMEIKEKMFLEILSKKRKLGEVADILSVSRQSVSKWLATVPDGLGMAGATPKEKLQEFKKSFPYLMPTL